MAASLEAFLIDNARTAPWWNAWLNKDPEEDRARSRLYSAQRRARKLAARLNDLSLAQWREIQVAYKRRCVYCGRRKPLTMDHIIPLSKGGQHTYTNIVPACQSCNSRKAAGAPLVPVQPLLLTFAQSRKRRLRA